MWVSLMGEWPPRSPVLQTEPRSPATRRPPTPEETPAPRFRGPPPSPGVQSRAEAMKKRMTDLPGRGLHAQEAGTMLCPVFLPGGPRFAIRGPPTPRTSPALAVFGWALWVRPKPRRSAAGFPPFCCDVGARSPLHGAPRDSTGLCGGPRSSLHGPWVSWCPCPHAPCGMDSPLVLACGPVYKSSFPPAWPRLPWARGSRRPPFLGPAGVPASRLGLGVSPAEGAPAMPGPLRHAPGGAVARSGRGGHSPLAFCPRPLQRWLTSTSPRGRRW